jgi:signal transduction histidine kinase
VNSSLAAISSATTATKDALRQEMSHGRAIVLASAAVGVVLTTVSVAMELTDAEPRSEMWVSAAAGAAFLVAVPFVRGDDDGVLTSRARLLIGAGGTAVLAVIGLWRATGRAQPAVLLLLVPALLLFATALLAIREAGNARHARRVRQLRARFQGQESERRRWAQELHDQTLQDLAAIELRLAGLSNSQDPQALAAGVQDTRVMVREQIQVLRHLITQMRPLALDTLGLAAAVQDLARRAESGEVTVTCDIADIPDDLTPDAQVAIYRIIQEALSNALHHAACQIIAVTADRAGPDVVITVQDDGVGLPTTDDPSVLSFGRTGMRERADAIDAQLTWIAPAGGGTVVQLRIQRTAPAPTRPARSAR